MPWHVAKSAECPDSKPWAVIKDSDGTVEGCHETEADANDQMKALYANESDAARNVVAMWTLRQDGERWQVLDADGKEIAAFDGAQAGYSSAVAWLADQAIEPAPTISADSTEPPPGVLAERWQSGPNGIVLAAATDDGRDFTGCTFTWRPAAAPLPLMFLTETTMGHFEAQLAGFIDTQGDPTAAGAVGGWFHDSDVGRLARDVLRAQGAFGCSVDPGMVSASFICTEEATDDWGDYCVDGVLKFEAYEIAGVTLVPFPAFAQAAIELVPDTTPDAAEPIPITDPIIGETVAAAEPEPDAEPVEQPKPEAQPVEQPPPDAQTADVVDMRDRRRQVAASAPLRPPAEWLTAGEPDDTDPAYIEQRDGQLGIPLTILDSGRVFGHAGLWETCHIGYVNECVTPPASAVDYAHFHVGSVVVDNGSEFATGALVAGCDHAAVRLRAAAARDHYAHNGVGWADVRASNGRHGVWVTGALRPDVTPEQVRVLRAGSLSGDWRYLGAANELISVLAVNVPGFPILREALAASGLEVMGQARLEYAIEANRMVALVAAGRVVPRPDTLDALVAAGTVERCAECGKVARRRPTSAAQPSRGDQAVLVELRAIRAALATLEARTRPMLRQQADETRASLRAVLGN